MEGVADLLFAQIRLGKKRQSTMHQDRPADDTSGSKDQCGPGSKWLRDGVLVPTEQQPGGSSISRKVDGKPYISQDYTFPTVFLVGSVHPRWFVRIVEAGGIIQGRAWRQFGWTNVSARVW